MKARAATISNRSSRGRRRWLVGYVILVFGTMPLALPLWNNGLGDSIGRCFTVEQLHLVQYSVLGWLGGLYAGAAVQPARQIAFLVIGGVGMGLLDEAVQRWLPGRFFEWADVGLNVAGLGLGAGASVGWQWLKGVVTLGAGER